MKLKIEITMDNAAFDSSDDHDQNTDRIDRAPETARILRRLAERIIHDGIPGRVESWGLVDLNGNKVGEAELII